MKAYQIKIELFHTQPLVWRRVIMPADATFNRLNDVIHTVTNFQSGYPYEPVHLFAFYLPEDNISVTNDLEAYDQYQYYKKHRKEIEKRLAQLPEEYVEFERRRLKTVIRQPQGIKIDHYLEKYKELNYLYDFGDNWEFKIRLEEIIEDYPYGYPRLIEGKNDAPPEDVGGVEGFKRFLQVYNDKKHPEYMDIKKWADEQNFRPYEPEFINSMLKFIQYKKNEKSS